jgi:hypothetical protein
MGGRQLMHVVPLAISRQVPMESRSIPRRHPPFHIADRIAGKVDGLGGRATASANKKENGEDET